MEEFKQEYDENVSANLLSSMEDLKTLLQLLNSPAFPDLNGFMEVHGDEMKKDIEEDEEKAQVLLELMEYLERMQDDDEDFEWFERKKDELEEFLTVIDELKEFLPEDEDC